MTIAASPRPPGVAPRRPRPAPRPIAGADGFSKEATAILAEKGLSSDAKVLAIALCGAAWYGAMACWTGNPALEEATGLPTHRLRRAFVELEEAGWIFRLFKWDDEALEHLEGLGFVPPWDGGERRLARPRRATVLLWRLPAEPTPPGGRRRPPDRPRPLPGLFDDPPEDGAGAMSEDGAGARFTSVGGDPEHGAGARANMAPAPSSNMAPAPTEIPIGEIPPGKRLNGNGNGNVPPGAPKRGRGKKHGLPDGDRIHAAMSLRAELKRRTAHTLRLRDGGLVGLFVPPGTPAIHVQPPPEELTARLAELKPELLGLLRAEAEVGPGVPDAPTVKRLIRELERDEGPPAVYRAVVALMAHWGDPKPETARFLAGACNEVVAETISADVLIAHFQDAADPAVKLKPNQFVSGLAKLFRSLDRP